MSMRRLLGRISTDAVSPGYLKRSHQLSRALKLAYTALTTQADDEQPTGPGRSTMLPFKNRAVCALALLFASSIAGPRA